MSVAFFWMVSHLHYALAFLLGFVLPGRRSPREGAFYGALAVWAVFVLQHGLPSFGARGGGHWLSVLWGLPCAGALLLLSLPARDVRFVRRLSMAVVLMDVAVSACLLCSSWEPGWQYQVIREWVPAMGVRYHVAMDGISAWVAFCVTSLGALSVWSCWEQTGDRLKAYCVACMFLQGALLGALLAVDLLLFVLFWELACIPVVMLVKASRGEAEGKTVGSDTWPLVPWLAGSAAVLVALCYMAWEFRNGEGYVSFDLLALRRLVLTERAGWLCFGAFAYSFLSRIPLWPLHGWFPRMQGESSGAPVLSMAALPLGAYAYLRLFLSLFEDQAWRAGVTFGWIAILGCSWYSGLRAWRQATLGGLLAFAFVAQGGVVALGLFAATQSSLQGALFHAVSCMFSFAGCFLLLDALRRRGGEPHLSALGGLVRSMPLWTALLLFFTLSVAGMPGTSGFVGTFMVVAGTMVSQPLGAWALGQAVVAAVAVVLAGAILLKRVSGLLGGAIREPKHSTFEDLSLRESVALAPLVLLILVLGWRPQVLLQASLPGVTEALSGYVAGRSSALEHRGTQTTGLTPLSNEPKEQGHPSAPAEPLRSLLGWRHWVLGASEQKGPSWR